VLGVGFLFSEGGRVFNSFFGRTGCLVSTLRTTIKVGLKQLMYPRAERGDYGSYKKGKRYDSRGFLAPMSTEVEVLVYFLW